MFSRENCELRVCVGMSRTKSAEKQAGPPITKQAVQLFTVGKRHPATAPSLAAVVEDTLGVLTLSGIPQQQRLCILPRHLHYQCLTKIQHMSTAVAERYFGGSHRLCISQPVTQPASTAMPVLHGAREKTKPSTARLHCLRAHLIPAVYAAC